MKKKLWKRVTALILTGLLAITMAGCGGKEEQKEQEQAGDSTPTGLSGEYVYVPTFTVGADHHDGYVEHLDASAERFGKQSCRTVEGIACLGIHQHRAFQGFERMHHIADEREIGHEFLGGDAAEIAHQPALANEAVRGANDVVWRRIQQL